MKSVTGSGQGSLHRVRAAAAAAGRFLARGARATRAWISVPVNLCLALLGLLFLVSLGSWAAVDRFSEYVLYFPDGRGRLRGEMRPLPRIRGNEAQAELVASELLLGPRDQRLLPAFPAGVRAESVIARKSGLYVDLSTDAALVPPDSLRLGLEALRASLAAALPGGPRPRLTIGGNEPWAEGLAAEAGNKPKKTEK